MATAARVSVPKTKDGTYVGEPKFTLSSTSPVLEHLERVSKEVLLPLLEKHKTALIDIYKIEKRDAKPPAKLEPWAGGYAGFYLTVGSAIYSWTKNDALKKALDDIVRSLCSNQTPHGYLGPWPTSHEFKKDAPTCETPWDAWSHHQLLAGALAWHRASGSRFAGQLYTGIGDLLVLKFGADAAALHSLGAQQSSGVVLEAFTLMLELTGSDKYLEGAKTVMKFIEMPYSGNYATMVNTHKPFSSGQCTEWEALLTLKGMSRYANVAENRGEVLTIVETMWWDVCEHYRRCNGGLALGDVTASGNTPDTPPSVVGTHAWLALTGDMLVHSGYSVYGDELELSMYNAALAVTAGGQEDIPTQPRAKQPPVTGVSHAALCGPGLAAMAAAHSVHTLKTGIVFNLYHAGTFACTLQSGNHVKVDVTTAYPHAPTVVLKVHPQRRGELFSMVLRVPAWAHGTAVTINQMMSGDVIEMDFAFTPRFVLLGDSTTAMYYGPLLLARHPTATKAGNTPVVVQEASCVHTVVVGSGDSAATTTEVLISDKTTGNELARLCDYASACRSSEASAPDTKLRFEFGAAAPNTPLAFSRDNPSGSFTIDALTYTEASTAPATAGPSMTTGKAPAKVTPPATRADVLSALKSDLNALVPKTTPGYATPPLYSRRLSVAASPHAPHAPPPPSTAARPKSMAGVGTLVVEHELPRSGSVSTLKSTFTRLASARDSAVATAVPEGVPPSAADGASPARGTAGPMVTVTGSPAEVAGSSTVSSAAQDTGAETADGTRDPALSDAAMTELLEARAMQESLRKIKEDMFAKGAQSTAAAPHLASTNRNAATPPSSGGNDDEVLAALASQDAVRKMRDEFATKGGPSNASAAEGVPHIHRRHASTRQMLASALPATSDDGEGAGRDNSRKNKKKKKRGSKDAPPPPSALRSRSQTAPTAAASAATAALPRAVPPDAGTGEGYEMATGEEHEHSATAEQTNDEKRFEVNPEGVSQKPSWKASWRNMLRKVTGGSKTKRPKRRSTCSNVTDGTAVALKKAQDNSSGGTHSIASSRKPSAAGGWKPKQNPGCVKCGKTVYELEKVSADGQIWHKVCFRCVQCNKILNAGNFASLEGDLFCKPCFKKLFKLKGNYSEGFGKEQHKMKWLNTDKSVGGVPGEVDGDVQPEENGGQSILAGTEIGGAVCTTATLVLENGR